MLGKRQRLQLEWLEKSMVKMKKEQRLCRRIAIA